MIIPTESLLNIKTKVLRYVEAKYLYHQWTTKDVCSFLFSNYFVSLHCLITFFLCERPNKPYFCTLSSATLFSTALTALLVLLCTPTIDPVIRGDLGEHS